MSMACLWLVDKMGIKPGGIYFEKNIGFLYRVFQFFSHSFGVVHKTNRIIHVHSV